MKKTLQAILFLFVCLPDGVLAQTLTIGTGAYINSNVYGPANTTTTSTSSSRYAYIYPVSLLNGLKPGDTITSIEFHRNGNSFPLTGTSNMRIFMRNTVKTTYGAASIN